MNNLTIYKASAGSGKTYTLVRDYLQLLFSDPYNYKQILAVTFTNKATAEMKRKIINELFLLSQDDDNTVKGEKSEHREFLLHTFPTLNHKTIKKRAFSILGNMLNNYSQCFISTIDKFFQYIIKSFSKELGIYNNYALQLDHTTILSEAVDQLFAQLDKDEHKNLLKWLSTYAEERVEQGERYDILSDIKMLGEELFKEHFKKEKKELFNVLQDKDSLFNITKKIREEIREIENTYILFGNKGLQIMASFNLSTTDFKQTTRSGMNVFKKLSNKKIDNKLISTYTTKMATNDEEWITKKSPLYDTVISARDNGLKQHLLDFLAYNETHYEKLQSLRAIYKNLYTLGIFVDLNEAIQAYTAEHNILLLSDSNELISHVIGDNDTPFIYEKAGTKFNHFMIDEFQDTSDLQWHNFKPLFQNSLATGFANLIVGDVKQSIYRWRNTNWKLLAEDIYHDFSSEQRTDITLEDNWRSSEKIVSFNNAVFKVAPEILQNTFNGDFQNASIQQKEMIIQAYKGQAQKIQHQNDYGFVRIKKYEKNDEYDVKRVFDEVITNIEDAQSRNFKAGDIAILVRTNKEGADFIKYIMAYKDSDKAKAQIHYDVISSDSLLLDASDSVRFIANILSLETEKNNPLILSEINYFYNSITNSNASQFNVLEDHKVVLHKDIAKRISDFHKMSLHERSNEIIARFQLNKNSSQLMFLEAFMDMQNEYISRNASDIAGFVQFWKDSGRKYAVQPPNNKNAIQVMTIHKAKGLEFPIVILPFANWKMGRDKNQNIMWCKVPETLNLPLPVVPIKLTSALKETYFKDYLMSEELLTYVDNLNVLYVALTRAKHELYIYGKNEKKGAMELMVHSISNFPDTIAINRPDENTYEIGTQKIQEELEDKGTQKINQISLDSIPKKKLASISVKIKAPKTFAVDENTILEKAHIGTLLHEIFRMSDTLKEVILNTQTKVREGSINHSDGEALIKIITQKFNNDQINDWFSPAHKYIKEVSILKNGIEYRPDKIIRKKNGIDIIDYKFGKPHDSAHKNQVQQYINLLQEMGYTNIKGYLWYVIQDKIVCINN